MGGKIRVREYRHVCSKFLTIYSAAMRDVLHWFYVFFRGTPGLAAHNDHVLYWPEIASDARAAEPHTLSRGDGLGERTLVKSGGAGIYACVDAMCARIGLAWDLGGGSAVCTLAIIIQYTVADYSNHGVFVVVIYMYMIVHLFSIVCAEPSILVTASLWAQVRRQSLKLRVSLRSPRWVRV